MDMHLVMYFCGTGNPGNSFLPKYDYVNSDHVKTIFVKGCDEPEVCDSALFPNLKSFANRFVNALFGIELEDRQHSLEITPKDESILESIGIRLDRSSSLVDMQGKPIKSITLCGFSRGAVTCFEVARVLNKIAPHIPVDIVADQPVPGNAYQVPGSNARSIANCSDLKNVKNVSVILGAYTGAKTEFDIHIKRVMPDPDDLSHYKNNYLCVGEEFNEELYYVDEKRNVVKVDLDSDGLHECFVRNDIDVTVEKKHTLDGGYLEWFTTHQPEEMKETTSIIHRGFFSQILPKLPRAAKQEHIVIPRESHHQVRTNAPEGEEHMHMKVAEFLSRKNSDEAELVSEDRVSDKVEQARKTYTMSEHLPPAPFPQISKLQRFFGIDIQDAYRYVDKLHPARNLRKGMMFKEEQTLYEWWQQQEENASFFSTKLTKDLVETIIKTEIKSADGLKELYIQADKWLIAKENTTTSRYYQVESLRNNIYHDLINKHGISKEELHAINRQTLHETKYFLNHWSKQSAAASWFKTEETVELDKAFKEHAEVSPYSKEADEKLIKAMEQWVDAKKDSKSRRFDLVVDMLEHLTAVVANSYQVSAELHSRLL